ncbi:extracellular matrix glycoprotein pherophorin I [Volvox carteri f. nagariensis]|uniref:Perphorin-1 n=2 Tax=Volvox carteri TaxID=3067 RepID=PER1_VOLCA|nr:extracellular matrix glycoprotein pherophorin I [Volvox carteri f. nagariensis]P81131.1 RecName: Full=Perphorin-1; AltName: Full=Perphorin I; Flags: Precursor [Volvox carteri]EFJ49179.1 extracellular matrix glycoprotein pherophorin I [Volvox carteri f. nagariensis]CAB56808.1 Pherophorin I [Volvox carteri f. nagariensis]|eukprot:XP_002949627.1 extracellular matrix glycoprotein pherophorin I [Volvox carteri f. nagariensis]
MMRKALLALCVATAFAVAQAQNVAYPNFPYCQCIKSPSPYSLEPVVKSNRTGQYCFTLRVTKPSPSATGYCATKADIKKIEINVNQVCDVFGNVVNATLNGVPTKVGPAFDTPPDGPNTSRILRFTQLNLGLDSDGAMLCITLGQNDKGKGCTTLEDLCAPPAGAPKGTCSLALFDSKPDCCPISRVSPPAPPPPPPPPPPEPVAVPITPPCKTCVYATITALPPLLFPFQLTPSICQSVADKIAGDLEMIVTSYSIGYSGATITCSGNVIKVCASFSLPPGAPYTGLQADISNALTFWLSLLAPSTGCPAYFANHQVTVTVGGDGDPNSVTCLEGTATTTCKPGNPDFPKCECETKPAATRFAALPTLTQEPGRPSNRTNSTLYCFTLQVVAPLNPNGLCGNTTTLLKAELWGNDIPTQRRKILALAFKAAGASSPLRYLSPSWGSAGEQTLKVSGLNWDASQADGAKICMELSNDTNLKTFCNTGQDTCWINLFSPDKQCCPLFAASLTP